MGSTFYMTFMFTVIYKDLRQFACVSFCHIHCSYSKGSIRVINSCRLTSRLAYICFSFRHLPEVGKFHLLAVRSEDEPARLTQ